MKLEIDARDGRTVEVLKPRQIVACPVCEGKLKMTKSHGANGKYVEGGDRAYFVNHRGYRCDTCEFYGRSTEWRPVPDKGCCESSLSGHNTVSRSTIVEWRGQRLWQRDRTNICSCGLTWAWIERLVLGFADGGRKQ